MSSLDDLMKYRRSDWYSPQELAELVGFTAQFIRSEIKNGVIPAERWGSQLAVKRARWRIFKTDGDAYVARMHGRSTTHKVPTKPTDETEQTKQT